MLAFLRGALIVAAVAWWSPTHEPSASLRSEADRPRPVDRRISPPSPAERIDAAESLAELRRAVRDAEALQRAVAGSLLIDAVGDGLARARSVREATAAGDGQAGQAALRPR